MEFHAVNGMSLSSIEKFRLYVYLFLLSHVSVPQLSSVGLFDIKGDNSTLIN